MLVQPIFAEIREIELAKPRQPVATVQRQHATATSAEATVGESVRAASAQNLHRRTRRIVPLGKGRYRPSRSHYLTAQIEDHFERSVNSTLPGSYPRNLDEDSHEPLPGAEGTPMEIALLLLLLLLIIIFLLFNVWRLLFA